MTTRTSLRAIVQDAGQILRRDAGLAVIAVACAVVPAILLVGWVVGGWGRPSFIPLVLEIVCLAGAVLFLVRARRRLHHTLDEGAVTRAAEERMSLPAGALRGALELDRSLPAGASAALAQRSERVLAARLDGVPASQITGDLGESWRRQRTRAVAGFAILVVAVTALGFATPTRSRAAWAPLLHPVRNLTPPSLPPLEVLPGNATVARGTSLDIRIRAPQREAVTLHWRVEGDIAREHTLPILRDTALHALSSIDGATEYWVEAPDGAQSAHFVIAPVDPLLLSSLTTEIIYPEYLRRTNDHYEGELPALELPQGTEIMLRGRATRPLAAGVLRPDSGAAVSLRMDDAGFSTRWVPVMSGTYAWELRDASGKGLAVQPPPIGITIVRDEPPAVAITFPGVDTVFGPELQLAVAADVQDDYGIAAVALISWRVSRTGVRDAVTETPMMLGAGEDHALVRAILDASARGLAAGDTLKYFVRVRDNSPRGQVAESRTYAIRLPGMDELRDAAKDQTDALMKANAELSRAAAKLQEDTRNTERRTAASNTRRASSGQGDDPSTQSGQRMQFEEAQAAQKILEQQQQMMKSVDEMRAKVDALQKSMENAGLQDAELQKRLAELRQLYDQALTPELRKQMDALKQALEKLDPKAVERALEQLAQQQEQMKEQLERSLDLMRKAAAEQQMNRLSQESKELARQQDALAGSQADQKMDPASNAKQQADLARKNDALAKEIDALREQLAKQGEAGPAEQTRKAGDLAKDAQESMARAAQQAAAQKPESSAESGKQAARALNDAAAQLDKARNDMVQGWKDEVEESMQQATRDALSLAQRQQALKDQMEKGQQPSLPQPSLPKPGQDEQGGQKQPGQSPQQGGKPQSGDQGRSGGAGGQSQAGQKDGGQQGQPGGRSGQQGVPSGQQGSPQPGQPGAQQGGQQSADALQSMRSEQAALQQGLQQLSRNLADTGDRSAMVNRDVGSSLSRANQSMQKTQDKLQSATPTGDMPSNEAAQTVDALNKLALSLLKNSQEVQKSESGTGAQQMMQQMSDMAKKQGSLNGEGSSLLPMNLSAGARSEQVRKLGESQQQIAQQLEDVRQSAGRDKLLGSIDDLAKEAAAIAADMRSGQLQPQTLARQEKLFHRMLDAGRSLEKDEISQERVAERPGSVGPAQAGALDPRLFDDATRFRAPTPAELRALPPAYRKLILDYFDRLNRQAPADSIRR